MAQTDSRQLFMQAGGGSYPLVSDPAPTFVAGDALLVRPEVTYNSPADVVERTAADAQGSSRITTPTFANVRSELGFTIDVNGSGVAGTLPAWAPCLVACGGAWTTVTGVSNTFALSTLNSATAFTNYMVNIAGVNHFCLGARGNAVATFTSGELPTLEFTNTGLFLPPVTAAALVPTYASSAPPKIVNAANTPTVQFDYEGTPINICLQTASLDFGNTVNFSDQAGCKQVAEITARQPTLTMTYRDEGLGHVNLWQRRTDETLQSFKLVHGPAGARSTLTFTPSSLEIGEPFADGNGILHRTINLLLKRAPGTTNFFTWKMD